VSRTEPMSERPSPELENPSPSPTTPMGEVPKPDS
jgi:hypothetical protein